MYKAAMLLLLLSTGFSCAHVKKNKTLEQICTPILSEILSIQDERNILMDAMETDILLYKNGSISKDKYKEAYKKWLKDESVLRTKVTELYDTAYNIECL